jgi:hypothetical protein
MFTERVYKTMTASRVELDDSKCFVNVCEETRVIITQLREILSSSSLGIILLFNYGEISKVSTSFRADVPRLVANPLLVLPGSHCQCLCRRLVAFLRTALVA